MKNKFVKFLYRLSLPLFLIYCILVYISQPFLWLFTGEIRYKESSFVARLMYSWIINIDK